MDVFKQITRPKDIKKARKLLAEVFIKDPFFTTLYKESNRLKQVEFFFDYILNDSVIRNEIVLGLERDSELISVAIIEPPLGMSRKQLLHNPKFIWNTLKFRLRIPKASRNLLMESIKLLNSVRPKEPHYYFHFQGVKTEFQRQGIGRMFMNYVFKIVDEDPRVIGVGVDAMNFDNVKINIIFGFELITEMKFSETTIYYLFKYKK